MKAEQKEQPNSTDMRCMVFLYGSVLSSPLLVHGKLPVVIGELFPICCSILVATDDEGGFLLCGTPGFL